MIAYTALVLLGLFAAAMAVGRWRQGRAPKVGTWPQHPLP